MDLHSPVRDFAVERPLSTRVFHRHHIDFCCGGGVPLEDACAARGLDVQTVLAEIEAETERSADTTRWDQEPLEALIRHILVSFHHPLSQELPRLDALATKVARVHSGKGYELEELARLFSGLRAELELHMQKEEQVLFPLIVQGQGAKAHGPITALESEHDGAGQILRRLREITHDYNVPEGACTSWRALWAGLEQLEHDLHEHIHLENNVLHPRALGTQA